MRKYAFILLFIAAHLSAKSDQQVAGDCFDPIIPEYLLDEISVNSLQYFDFPYLDTSTEPGVIHVSYDFDETSSQDQMVLTVTINNDIGEIVYEEIMDESGIYEFEFPVVFGDLVTVSSSIGEFEASAVIYNCSSDESVFDGYIGNGGILWQGVADCPYTPFLGSWEICAGPEGSFSILDSFETTFSPSDFGVYTLCFTSACTGTVYSFDFNFNIWGCTDELACNYDSNVEPEFDNGSCYYDCDGCFVGNVSSFFIPDNQEQCYQQTITVEADADAIIDSADDIQGFLVKMEHSFIGDLVITFICPNGQSLVVHEQGGSGIFAGEPIDDDGDPLNVGVCYEYWWTPDAEWGTWAAEGESATPLIEGEYTSSNPWSDLYGCPVNGDWQLEICDMWASDNGYLCLWGMTFDGSLNFPDCVQGFQSGCMDPLACNFNENAEIDDATCNYTQCINIEHNSTITEYCDSTHVVLSFAQLEPEWAEFTLEIPGDEFTIEVDDVVDFWMFDDGNYSIQIHTTLSENQLAEEIETIEQFTVSSTPDTPLLVIGDESVTCENCIPFNPHWYFNGDYSGQGPSFGITIPGVLYACISHDEEPFCEVCSEVAILTVGVEELGHDIPQLLNNGSPNPQFIAVQQGNISVYNASGQLIWTEFLHQGEQLNFEKYATGLYVLKFNEFAIRMEIIR